MCNSFFFKLTENTVFVHYNKFPNSGVYHANFHNLKSPRAPSQNCQKKSLLLSLKIFFVFSNSADPDVMPHYAAFHLGLHCLPK